MIMMMMIVSLESELHGQTGVTPLTAQLYQLSVSQL